MKTVMIVDDSKTVRSYHGSILTSMGLNIIEAANGMEALEKSLESDIDLYLVDVNMPIMDGYTLTAELRKNNNNKTVPIIMVTTQEAEEDKISSYKIGANFFEVKPIKPDKLKAYVELLVKS
ncbi:MAG: response regulator [Sulfurimonas sp.]|jgi:two-component system chemotaxis response regulator CheY|nr:response regulator [Sulfurimonas sp.]MBU4023958.1 response regulator [bacterium]